MSSNKIQPSPNNIIYNQDGSITICPLVNHKHTLIWLHGLACSPQSNLNAVLQSLSDNFDHIKVVIPKAPTRYVTIMKKRKAFIVPFEEAFSEKQVVDSYQKVLWPIIKRQREILDAANKNNNNKQNKLIISGFSQGCGMALHCLYHSQYVDAALGIAGYLFPITNFKQQLNKPKRIIYGLNDKLRPWEYTKVTYQNKIDIKDIRLVEDMAHDLRKDTIQEMKQFFNQVIGNNSNKQEIKE